MLVDEKKLVQACSNCNSTLIYKHAKKGWHCYRCETKFVRPIEREHSLKYTIRKNPKRGRENILNPEGIKSLIDSMDNKPNKEYQKAFVVILYLLGARIGEITSPKKKDADGFIIYPDALKKINFVIDDEFCMVHNVKTLKTRTKFQARTIPIDLTSDKELWNIFWNYAQNKSDTAPLFRLTARGANALVSKKTGYFPHFFRHCRLSHLVQYRGFNAIQLKKFTGWKTIAPSDVYVNLDVEDIKEAMRRSRKNDNKTLY